MNDSNLNVEEELQRLKERGKNLDIELAEVLDSIRTLNNFKFTLPNKYKHIELLKEFCDTSIED